MRDIRKSIRHLNRYQEILRIFVKYGFWDIVERIKIGLIPDLVKKIVPQTEKKGISTLNTAERLRMAFEELGATFIKLGQMLSLRPDLIPPEIAQEFTKLQDEVTAHPFEDLEVELKHALKIPIKEIFAEFEMVPVAAASMAQVHKARLKSGEQVAVKVLRPKIGKQIATDVDILLNLAQLIEKHIPESKLYDPIGIVKEFDKTIQKELNLTLEGRNMDIFRRYTEKDTTIKTPRVYWEFSTKNVLVMEFIDGVKISEADAFDKPGIDGKQVAENGARSLLKQIFEYGFFHADPHPGNFFVLPGNIIVPIDFGNMGRIDEEMKDDLLEILRGIIEKDAYRITRTLIKIGSIEDQINSRALQRDILELIDRYYGIPLNRLDAAVPLNEFMKLIREHHLKLPIDLVMMGRALVISEAVGMQLYPEFNLFELLIPYTKGVFISRLNPFTQSKYAMRLLEESMDLIKNLPEDIQNILLKIRNDRVGINLHHVGLEDFTREMERSSNRIAFALIIAALIVGSSLVIQLNSGPFLWGYPALGIIGYVLASALGIWLLISILKSGKL